VAKCEAGEVHTVFWGWGRPEGERDYLIDIGVDGGAILEWVKVEFTV
jgi:hypothetical protein